VWRAMERPPERGPVTEQVRSRAKWLNNALDTVPVLTIRTFPFQSVIPVRIQSSQRNGRPLPVFSSILFTLSLLVLFIKT